MDSLRIRLLGDNITGYLDLTDDELFPFELEKGLFDFTSLNTRKGETSNAFNIPLTANNRKVLDHIYSINTKAYKGAYLNIDCEVLVNDEVFGRGVVKINKVTTKKGSGLFEAEYISNNTEWIEKLNGLTMADITFDSKAIPYTLSHIRSTHTNTYTDEYVFAHINRGQRAYSNCIYSEDLFPDFFLIKWIEKLFATVGYTVGGEWVEDANVRKLIISFFGERFKVKQSIIDNKYARVSLNSDTYQISLSSNTFSINETPTTTVNWNDSTSPNSDVGNHVSGKLYTASEYGYYKFKLTPYVNLSGQSGYVWQQHQAKVEYKLKVNRGGVISYYPFDNILNYWVMTAFGSQNNLQDMYFTGSSPVVKLSPNDTVEVVYDITVINGGVFKITHKAATNLVCEMTDKISNGYNFNLNDVTDNRALLIDMLEDVIKVGNLIPITDNNINKVYLRTFDNHITALSTAVDWTDKVDVSQPIAHTKISDTYKRFLEFEFADDGNDGYLEHIKESKGKPLFSYTYDFGSGYNEGIEKVKLKEFAPSYYLEDVYAVTPQTQTGLYQYTPNVPSITTRIWSEYSSSPPALITNHKPRLLFYKYGTQQTSNGTLRKILWADQSTPTTSIPYAMPQPIIVDGVTHVSCGFPVMWDNYNASNLGLIETYYSKQLRRVDEGLRVVAKMYIDNVTYNNWKFRTPIYLNVRDYEGYYIIEEIKGYKPHKATVCEVILLTHQNFEGVSIPIGDPIDQSGDDILTSGGGSTSGDSAGYDSGSNLKMGDNNEPVSGMSQILWGNNLVGSQKKGQVIVGQYNEASDDSVLIVGNGTNEQRSNAIEVKTNGDVLIGGGCEVLTLSDNGDYVPVYTLSSSGNLAKVVTK